MSANIIDGKAAATELRGHIAKDIAAFTTETGQAPGLRVILVGNNPASQSYVGTKERTAIEVGIAGGVTKLPTTTSQTALLDEIAALNANPAVHGILVQLPLPDHIDETAIINAIDPAKDVDGFHPINVGRLFTAKGGIDPKLLVACTPMGSMILVRKTLGDDIAGAHAVVVGRSNIVGKPVGALLLAKDCTVTVAHSKTRDLPQLCRSADILVAAVGRAEMIRGDWIKPGATVIDVGINRIEGPENKGRGRLVGDVAFEEAATVAGAITPVPGGVGQMTVACLLRNTLIAAQNSRALCTRRLP
ncbi:MAG: bifunctional 5,10-methylenetetrahydrofolate dehydrogenase/5,10-methenyltetrahydrofolate cyclohydrolase [Geminicoccaceae bacterium]